MFHGPPVVEPKGRGAEASAPTRLARRLNLVDAVVVGLGAMIGAGVFVAFAPAAQAAGAGLLFGLVVAAAVAYCNAMSSARLAALYPQSGGTYVYARERLGQVWGYIAGWSFVVGKVASCAAIALTLGHYLAPSLEHPLAVAAVVALTVVNLRGIEKTALLTRLIVGVVLVALAAFVVAALVGGVASSAKLSPLGAGGIVGILRAGGFLFFAFAGYARIATLGEEVVDPAQTIPRAIPLALALTFGIYAVVAVTALAVAGPGVLAATAAPLKAVLARQHSPFGPAVQVGAAVGSLGVLLSLLAGVSRTAFAMARNGDLPRVLGAVAPRRRVPHHAELVVAAIVAIVAGFADIRGAIGFSSFCVLCYYALANASALTLKGATSGRVVAAAGLAGCVALAFALPAASVVGGAAVVAVGVAAYVFRRERREANAVRP
jgi:APA family basic amino acid/polyamine antiporter